MKLTYIVLMFSQKLTVLYLLTLNLYIKLDALYIDHNVVDIDLDASQCNTNAYTANSFTMHSIN